ncbi:MAG TPA: FlgD immunoglobulin-like domain containing protein, partial [Candidatus Syntrophosphaera sp.]|nr:FlgD immunoglobulin-like domain containing protein [Candidatus Syntrophosphaera sp.]
MRRLFFALMCLAAVAVYAQPLWPENLKLRGSVALEWTQASLALPDGGLLLVWSDAHATDRDIYAQRIDAQGEALWPEPRVVDNKQGAQMDPALAASSDGHYFIAWRDMYASTVPELRLQKIDAAGQLLWAAGGIAVTESQAWKYDLRLIPDQLGGVILSWTDELQGYLHTQAQSYAADGSRRWQEGGINLTNQEYYTITSVQADGQNGIVIAFSSEYVVNSCVWLNRIGPDGNPLWTAPICHGNGVDTCRNGLLLRSGNSLYLTWNDYTGMESIQYLHSYDLDGNPVWAQPLDITPGGQNWITTRLFELSPSDGGLFLPHVLNAGGNQAILYLRKFSPTGQALWGDGVPVEYDFADYYGSESVEIIPDDSGGCYLAWSRENPQYWSGDPYAQRLSGSGTPLWQSGVALDPDPGSRPIFRLHSSQNGLWVVWAASERDVYGLRCQLLNASGTAQLEMGGRLVYGGLKSMWTEGQMTLARSGDHLVLWNDDRFNDDRCQVYLQAVNPDGSLDFPANGIPVTAFTGASQYLATAMVLPDDRILVVWHDRRTGYYDLYTQLLDAQGNRLWDEMGVRVSAATDNFWISSVLASEEDGSFFIVWNEMSQSGGSYAGSLKAQKITAGQTQWGESGISLLQDPELGDIRLADLEGRYVLFSRRLQASGAYTHVYVQRFGAADGTPEPGWGDIGNQISQGSGVDVFARQGLALQARPEGIFALYSEASNEQGNCVMAQLLSPQGTMLLAPTGELVLDVTGYVYPIYTDCGAEDFAVLWMQYNNGFQGAFFQRFLYAPAPLWDAVALPENDSYYYTGPARLSNGAFLIGWAVNPYDPETVSDHSIEYVYVSPAGALYGTEPQYSIPVGAHHIHSLQAMARGNQTLFTWMDGSTLRPYKDEPIEHGNLWVRLVGNPTTALEDQLAPALPATLHPNHPNPFSGSTNMRYTLQDPAEIDLAVYNLRGQLVRTLEQGKRAGGEHQTQWDGRDNQGRS